MRGLDSLTTNSMLSVSLWGLLLTSSCGVLGCNLGFESVPLAMDGGVDTAVAPDALADGDTGVVPPDSTDPPDLVAPDTAPDTAGFDDQNCGLATNGVAESWDCHGAPDCGVSLLTFTRADGSTGVSVVCKESDTLRWFPYRAGEWWESFTLGDPSDRPLQGAWGANSPQEGPAVARRSIEGLLEWSFRDGFGPDAGPLDSVVFAQADGARPFTGDVDGDNITDLLVYYPTTRVVDGLGSSGADPATLSLTLPQAAEQSPTVQQVLGTAEGFSGPTLAFYKSGELQFIDVEAPDNVTSVAVASGAGTFANADGDEGVELVICALDDQGNADIEVYDMPTGELTEVYQLAQGAACLPGVERSADGSRIIVAYLPTAGVMLRQIP